MRTRLLLACGTALLLGASRALVAPGPGGAAAPLPTPDRSCKPSGPLAVELLAGERGADGALELELSIRPVLAMNDVAWRLETTPNVLVVEGAAEGDAARERGARTAWRARVLPPSDAARGEVRLVVAGTFEGSDELGRPVDERVEVVRALAWGEHAPVGPVVSRAGAASGEDERLVLLPAYQAERGRGARQDRRER